MSEALGFEVLQLTPISGGDISDAYSIQHADGKYFIKISKEDSARSMFQVECRDLMMLASEGKLQVPSGLSFGSLPDGSSFLKMDHINTARLADAGYQNAGRMLAKMHGTTTAEHYGLDHDNFIGSLHQSNTQSADLFKFYREQRLLPQIKLASDNGFLEKNDVSNLESLAQKIEELIPIEQPTLIHGDLWSGNLIGSMEDEVYFIDPSISYLHREMDIAMCSLFGGFAASFYESYEETLKLEKGWEGRMDIFQLYYLLVHLNLFGFSYKDSVMRITRKYQ